MIHFDSPSKSKTWPCSRCEGKGKIAAFGHVIGGVCFKCGGSGTQASRPLKTQSWAVHLPKIVEHPTVFSGPDFVYRESGATQAVAMQKARVRFRALKSQLSHEVTDEGMWAEPAAEYDAREWGPLRSSP